LSTENRSDQDEELSTEKRNQELMLRENAELKAKLSQREQMVQRTVAENEKLKRKLSKSKKFI